MNRAKKYADGRWKERIVLILISVPFVALVTSAGNKTFLLVESLNDHNRKPTPSPITTLVFQAFKSSLGMYNPSLGLIYNPSLGLIYNPRDDKKTLCNNNYIVSEITIIPFS